MGFLFLFSDGGSAQHKTGEPKRRTKKQFDCSLLNPQGETAPPSTNTRLGAFVMKRVFRGYPLPATPILRANPFLSLGKQKPIWPPIFPHLLGNGQGGGNFFSQNGRLTGEGVSFWRDQISGGTGIWGGGGGGTLSPFIGGRPKLFELGGGYYGEK